MISIGPIYFSRNKDQLLNENSNDFVEEILINQPNYVNGGSRLGKTDVLIAALLGPDYYINSQRHIPKYAVFG